MSNKSKTLSYLEENVGEICGGADKDSSLCESVDDEIWS